jgi:predicted nucleotidyltransferase
VDDLSFDTVAEPLRSLCASTDAVRLSYVFGSQVEGATGPLSDVDVGVLVDEDALVDPTASRARLAHDAVERNLEVAAQCCIDICNRTIAVEGASKPQDYYDAIRRQGELGVLPPDFARELAPLAGFRNVD